MLVALVVLGPAIEVLHDLEPARYVMPALLMALPLATRALLAPLQHGPDKIDLIVLALLAALAVPFVLADRSLVSRDFLLGQVRTTPSEHLPWLRERLTEQVVPGRRVLFEDGRIGDLCFDGDLFCALLVVDVDLAATTPDLLVD